jgi:hypothetical protein
MSYFSGKVTTQPLHESYLAVDVLYYRYLFIVKGTCCFVIYDVIHTKTRFKEMAHEFIKTSKGGESLMYENFLFRLAKKLPTGYWKCQTVGCPATAITDGQNITHPRCAPSHLVKLVGVIQKNWGVLPPPLGRCA